MINDILNVAKLAYLKIQLLIFRSDKMDILGLIISIIYILLIIFISSLISKKHSELSRKFVHILVCNWWIIVILFFNNVILASIVPFLFVIVNLISYKRNIFKSIERDDKSSLGTVYYALSCLVLTILSFSCFNNKLYAGIGLFVMGYGDGFAALIGSNFKSKEYKIFNNKKTLLGSLTMLIVTFITICIITSIYCKFSLLSVLILSIIATIIEFMSPFGLDNLTVPLITTLIAYLLF